ncbi:MAG: J domain-containing protein [Phycisphaerae bacterium]|nr:J domain-containing protein [Phycisphaerae bacterium]
MTRCYEVLGIRPGATAEQVHYAYKRLALRHHPDRTAGDPDSLAQFCRVTEAYRTLKEASLAHGGSRPAERCRKCHCVAELFRGLDGGRYCSACLLNTRRRYLPLPKFQTVRCIATIVLQGLALHCASVAAVTGDWRHGAAGALFVFAAMGALAHSVWTADVIHR